MYRATTVAALLFAMGSPLAGQGRMVIRLNPEQLQEAMDGKPIGGLPGGGGLILGNRAAAGTVNLPPGWSARADSGQLRNFTFDIAGKGYHLKLDGVGAIVYRAADSVSGPFQASATFTQTKASYSANGYGLIYGGSDLAGAGQRYVYFFVRGDGQYLIKQRDGAKTTDIVSWTASPAIKTVNAQDPAVNVVEIDAKSDPTKIAFKVNGQVVHSMAATPADVKGIVGLRGGHSLDLQVDGFVLK